MERTMLSSSSKQLCLANSFRYSISASRLILPCRDSMIPAAVKETIKKFKKMRGGGYLFYIPLPRKRKERRQMNEMTMNSACMYDEVEGIRSLNKVEGFDPRKYMRLIQNEGQAGKSCRQTAARILHPIMPFPLQPSPPVPRTCSRTVRPQTCTSAPAHWRGMPRHSSPYRGCRPPCRTGRQHQIPHREGGQP